MLPGRQQDRIRFQDQQLKFNCFALLFERSNNLASRQGWYFLLQLNCDQLYADDVEISLKIEVKLV